MSKRFDEVMADMWARCKEWNDEHEIGTPVAVVYKGEIVESVTTSIAHVMPTGIRVAVEGIADSLPLEAIETLSEQFA